MDNCSLVSLTQGKFAVVDDSDLDLVSGYNWRYQPGRNTEYAVCSLPGGKYEKKFNLLMHRLILGLSAGDGLIVDHLDRDGLNNRRSNLRIVTEGQNRINSRGKTGASPFKGVTRVKDRWRVKCHKDGVCHHGGYYDSPEDAARAYDELAKTLHGEYAYLNFP